MRLDKFGNPIYNDQDLFDFMYHGYQLNSNITVEPDSVDIKTLEEISGLKFFHPIPENTFEVKDYDSCFNKEFLMPKKYHDFDIESWIIEQCTEEIEITRVKEELAAFKERNMLNLLKYLKYLVDTFEEHNILWGVGRGSSVASYILYKIGVHSINSLKYNLDWREFLR